MKNIIALDVGTSSMRALLYTAAGTLLSSASVEYHSVFPQSGYVEQDPQSWKLAAAVVLSKIAAYMTEHGLTAEGIAVTSQRSSLIPVDEAGQPLMNAIMWQDKRTIDECELLNTEFGLEALYRRTGLRINPYFVLPKILWLRKNRPEIFSRMKKALGVQDYVIHCLTGEYVTDHSQACRTMLMNIERFCWEPDLLAFAGIDAEQLPRLVPPGSAAGSLEKTFASITGLPEGLPVAASGGDQQNAAAALGVLKPGVAEANTGTGSFTLAYAEKPVFDKSCRVLLQASAIPGAWVVEAGIFNSGSIYRWFKEQFCTDMLNIPNPYAAMDKEAELSGAGANGVVMIPHFEGSAAPNWNPLAKGLFFNLSLGSKRGDLNRAILEGIAQEIRENLELIEAITGKINIVYAAGGMTKSRLFCEIQADCYGTPVVQYRNSEASSLGACIVAAPALGVHAAVEDAFVAMSTEENHIFQPNEKNAAYYRNVLLAKRKLYRALVDGGVYETFGRTL